MSLCIHNRQEMSSEIYCITYYVRTKLQHNVDSRLKKRLIVAEFRCVSSKKGTHWGEIFFKRTHLFHAAISIFVISWYDKRISCEITVERKKE